MSVGGAFPDGLLDYMAASYLEPQLIMAVANDSATELLEGEDMMHNFTSQIDANFTLENFFLEAGPICRETLKICAFGGVVFDCCSNVEVVLTDMGKCFKIDVNKVEALKLQTQMQSGVSNGLQIFADYHKEEEINELLGKGNPSKRILDKYLFHEKEFSSNAYGIFAQSLETGFRVYVHSENEVAFMSSEGITVSPGTRVYSAISPARYHLLSENSWGNCISTWPKEISVPVTNYEHYSGPSSIYSPGVDSENNPMFSSKEQYSDALPSFENFTRTTLGNYSATRCKALCRADFYYRHCGCSPFVYNIGGCESSLFIKKA